MYATKFTKEHPHISVHPEDMGHLDACLDFARSIGKEEHLVKQLEYACHPTFFGKEAVTHLYADSAPHSFYFEVYPRGSEVTGKRLLNGGVIFHDSAQEWSVHT